MKALNGIVAILFSLGIVFVAGYLIGRAGKVPSPENNVSYDTVYVDRPVPVRDSIIIHEKPVITRTDTIKVPVTVEIPGDTVYVKIPIPISQIEATGKYYRAYISGFRPALDSIFVTVPEKIIYKNELRYVIPTWEIAIFGRGGWATTEPSLILGVSGRYNKGIVYGQLDVGYDIPSKNPAIMATVGLRLWKRQ